jgi:hypothetical protein
MHIGFIVRLAVSDSLVLEVAAELRSRQPRTTRRSRGGVIVTALVHDELVSDPPPDR